MWAIFIYICLSSHQCHWQTAYYPLYATQAECEKAANKMNYGEEVYQLECRKIRK